MFIGIFINMKPYEKFLNSSVGLQRLIDIYLELRKFFQDEGWREKDLEKPPYYSETMMRLYHAFGNERNILFQQVKDLGFNMSTEEYIEFLEPVLQKINDITPLKDGDNERGN
jgi:hypothetical protein